jgi:ABC-type lipoprotein release transport system permease subunit
MLQASLVLARLRSHLGRSLVLVAVVAVATGIALSALAVLRVADDPWAPLHAATHGGDVQIDSAPVRPDPRALAALPEVATVGELIQSGDTALQVHGQVLLVSLKRMPADREAMVVERPLLLAGRWFAAGDEVVFEATLADTLGVGAGDTVVLNGEHGRTVRVVGTAATTMQPNYPERLPGSVFAGAAVYDAVAPVGPARWSVALRLHDPSRADAVVARLNASGPVPPGRCPGVGWCARTAADIRENAFPSRIDEFAGVMLFFAVLMLIAAVLLIVTLLGSRLVSEARELTLLQVVGVTPARLALLIATEHALLAVAGMAAGIPVAGVVAPRIASSAATVFGSVPPRLSLGDVMKVGGVAVAVSVLVSSLGGLRAGRRSLAVVARGGSGRVRRSRAAALALRSTSWATLVLGLKDVATRRGRAAVTVLSVALAVTIAVAVVGLGTSELDPAVAPTQVASLPADPAGISELPVFSPAISQQVVGRIMLLITAMQALLGGVAVVTLLAAASMSIRERLRELSVLHAVGCTTPQLAGASAISQGALGAIGAALGLPLGLGAYLLFKSMAGGGFSGSPPPPALALIAVAAIAIAAAAGAVPALLAQRVPTSQALAVE